MKTSLVEMLIKNEDIDRGHDQIATNFIKKIGENEVVLSGNKLGLILLADYILSIALSTNTPDHIHLDESNFFDTADVELIIEKL